MRSINEVKNKEKNLSDLKRRLSSVFSKFFNKKKSNFLNVKNKIELLSPEEILKRGYSITIDSASKKIIKSVNDVKDGQTIKTMVSDGSFDSTVQI